MAGHARWAPTLRRSHRVARRTHPGHQFQLRLFFTTRIGRRRDRHRRIGRVALFLRNEQRQDGWWVVGLWLVMAVTSLTKGLLGFVLPMMVIGVYSCLADGWAELDGGFPRPSRLVASDGSSIATDGSSIGRSLVAIPLGARDLLRAVRDLRPRAPAPEGPRDGLSRKRRALFPSIRPSRPDLSLSLRHLRPDGAVVGVPARRARPGASQAGSPEGIADAQARRRGHRFTLVFFWATFIFFTLSGSRRSYYILPILPPAAMLVARLLTTPFEALSPLGRRLLWLGYAVIAIAVIGGAIVMIPPPWIFQDRWRNCRRLPTASSTRFAGRSRCSRCSIRWTLRHAAGGDRPLRRSPRFPGLPVHLRDAGRATSIAAKNPSPTTVREQIGPATSGVGSITDRSDRSFTSICRKPLPNTTKPAT